VADVPHREALLACRRQGRHAVVVGGRSGEQPGAVAGEQRCRRRRITCGFPPMRLCTDNGAMIAAVGDLLVRAGRKPPAGRLRRPSVVLERAQLN